MENSKNESKITQCITKTKKATQNGIKQISEMPIEKIALGITIAVVPGGTVISGAYLAKKKYDEYLKTTENPEPFLTWVTKESNQYLSELSGNTKKVISDSTTQVIKYTQKSGDYITDISDKSIKLIDTSTSQAKQYTENTINKAVGHVSSVFKRKP